MWNHDALSHGHSCDVVVVLFVEIEIDVLDKHFLW